MVKTYAQVVKNIEEEIPVEIQYFPIEVWIIIWKKLFTLTVLKELKNHKSVWSPEKIQGKKLKQICSEDVGAIQFGYTDFDKLVDDHYIRPQDINIPEGLERFMVVTKVERHLHDICLNGDCKNCSFYGFPCTNLTWTGLSRNCKQFAIDNRGEQKIQYGFLWKVK